MKRLYIIGLILVAMMSSCNITPRNAYQTKAVILDSYNDIEVIGDQYMYRIYVPTYGITHSYGDYQLYEQGDTVLIHDVWRNYDIK